MTTIAQAKSMRRHAEAEIFKILRDLEMKSGLKIEGVHFVYGHTVSDRDKIVDVHLQAVLGREVQNAYL